MNLTDAKFINMLSLLMLVLSGSFFQIATSVKAADSTSATIYSSGSINQGTLKVPQQIALYSYPDNATLKRYNYAIVSFSATPAQLKQMRVVNPNLKIYVYRNFEATNTQADYSTFKANGWILKDSTGADLQCTDITTEYLIDPGSTAYRNWLVSWCAAQVAMGYDGVFADNFPRPRTPNSYRIGSKTIIDPRTGVAYTDDQWVADELATLTAVKTVTSIIGNGIPQANDVTGYTANKARADQIIASNIDGLMVEGPVAWSLSDFNSRSEAVWKSNMDLLKMLVGTGKIVMFSNTGSSDLETDAIATFVYCSYMMVGPTPLYSLKFRGGTYMDSSVVWTNLVNLNLGRPLGDYYKNATTGDYTRLFTNGTVTVNPVTKVAQVKTG